ncbi:hypothetical protein H4S08_000532 [Coemansia sp. RSA 1365]|nr:hypothetical protein H4S08_000532 [Coemansia sp. RSA 1365]
MVIVSSILARVHQLAETRPTFTHTNSEYDFFVSQPKGSAVEHMTLNDSHYTLRDMRFGGFNTFNRWNLFANNWYADMQQAAQQCDTLAVELASTIETITKKNKKCEALEVKLTDTMETATEERQKREALEVELQNMLQTVTKERQERKALEAKLIAVCRTAGVVKQRLDEDLLRACQLRQMLQLKMDDTLNAAVGPNQQFELLDFKLIDVLDKIKELKRRHLALEMAVEKQHEIVEYNPGDARKAMDELHRRQKGRREATQRKHFARNESLPAVIQPKPAEVAQLMSPPSTPHDSSEDEF